MYMLDTDTCVDLIRGRGKTILRRLREHAIGDVAISAITLAELAHGVEKSATPAQNRIALREFTATLVVSPFGDEAAVAYGAIRARLEREGRIIGPMDLLIAANALADRATVVTRNEREFRRVEGLAVENWSAS